MCKHSRPRACRGGLHRPERWPGGDGAVTVKWQRCLRWHSGIQQFLIPIQGFVLRVGNGVRRREKGACVGLGRKGFCSGCQIIRTKIRTQLACPFILWKTQNLFTQRACKKVELKGTLAAASMGRTVHLAGCIYAPLQADPRQPGSLSYGVALGEGLPSPGQSGYRTR